MATDMNVQPGLSTADRDGFEVPEIAVTLVAALATAFMLEASRLFFSYTVFVIDQENRGAIALIAFGVFAAFAAGGMVSRILRPRQAVTTTVTLLVAARLAVQFVEAPEARLFVAAVSLVAWGWLLPPLRVMGASDTARGVAYGLLIDVGIRFLFGTVDLPWMPTVGRHATTVILAAALAIATLVLARNPRSSVTAGAGPSLMAVGPGLALYHLLVGNFGVYEVKSDLPIQAMVWIVAIGIGAGFAVQVGPPGLRPGRAAPTGWAVAVVLTIFALLALLAFWHWDGVWDVTAVVVAGVAAQLLVLAVRGRDGEGRSGAGADGLWLTLGMLLQAAVLFAYHAESGYPLLIGASLALLGLGAALTSPFRGPLPPMPAGRHLPAMIVAAAALLVFGLFVSRSWWDSAHYQEVLGAELTVVTYNVQAGFSLDHRWDLERQAEVLEALDPDVVLLQEVSRGWVVTSGVDEARWLSERLDMNLVWGPSSRDGLWGLAILTRGDVLGAELRIFDLTQNLRRGVLGAAIETGLGPLYVYNTHLDNPATGDAVRFAQVTQLLAIADGTPAILGGDFNAPPDSEVIAAVLNAGFVDAGASLPPDLSTREGALRIDYLFFRGPVRVEEIEVLEETASDHKPVVARLFLE